MKWSGDPVRRRSKAQPLSVECLRDKPRSQASDASRESRSENGAEQPTDSLTCRVHRGKCIGGYRDQADCDNVRPTNPLQTPAIHADHNGRDERRHPPNLDQQ